MKCMKWFKQKPAKVSTKYDPEKEQNWIKNDFEIIKKTPKNGNITFVDGRSLSLSGNISSTWGSKGKTLILKGNLERKSIFIIGGLIYTFTGKVDSLKLYI